MPAYCPECEEEIEGLNYSVACTEYGSCNLDGNEWDRSDFDNYGDAYYTCPECGDEIIIEDIIHKDDPEPEPITAKLLNKQMQ